MKKLILPLLVLTGLGIGAYLLFGKKNGTEITKASYRIPAGSRVIWRTTITKTGKEVPYPVIIDPITGKETIIHTPLPPQYG